MSRESPLQWSWFDFESLSGSLLYECLQLRSKVFVVEQNRDAQMHSLLVNELGVDPARLVKVLHYDGTPITARYITQAITEHVHALAVAPRRERIKS